MTHAYESLNILAVLVVSFIGFALGAVWYSPLLFIKQWLVEMKLTPEMVKANSGRMVPSLVGGFLCTVVSTFTLAAVMARCHPDGWVHGAALGLVVGAGLVAAREGTNAIFEGRTLRHFLITSGHDVVLFVLQGAILAVWR